MKNASENFLGGDQTNMYVLLAHLLLMCKLLVPLSPQSQTKCGEKSQMAEELYFLSVEDRP